MSIIMCRTQISKIFPDLEFSRGRGLCRKVPTPPPRLRTGVCAVRGACADAAAMSLFQQLSRTFLGYSNEPRKFRYASDVSVTSVTRDDVPFTERSDIFRVRFVQLAFDIARWHPNAPHPSRADPYPRTQNSKHRFDVTVSDVTGVPADVHEVMLELVRPQAGDEISIRTGEPDLRVTKRTLQVLTTPLLSHRVARASTRSRRGKRTLLT